MTEHPAMPNRLTALAAERLGVVMVPEDPRESWGVLNPAGVRAAGGSMHLFPRIVAKGNCSRIAHAQVRYRGYDPVGVERLGTALEPREPYDDTDNGSRRRVERGEATGR